MFSIKLLQIPNSQSHEYTAPIGESAYRKNCMHNIDIR
jgi:hypothetical protein